MTDKIKVNPDGLRRESNNVLDAMTQSRTDHNKHHDTIAEALSGWWIGESAAALREMHASWEDQRTQLHKKLGNISTRMQEAAYRFASQEDVNEQRFGQGGKAL